MQDKVIENNAFHRMAKDKVENCSNSNNFVNASQDLKKKKTEDYICGQESSSHCVFKIFHIVHRILKSI